MNFCSHRPVIFPRLQNGRNDEMSRPNEACKDRNRAKGDSGVLVALNRVRRDVGGPGPRSCWIRKSLAIFENENKTPFLTNSELQNRCNRQRQVDRICRILVWIEYRLGSGFQFILPCGWLNPASKKCILKLGHHVKEYFFRLFRSVLQRKC